MSDKKHKLLDLAGRLNLPFTKEELDENMNHLNDSDLELLISTYEDILKCQDLMSEELMDSDNDKYQEIVNQRDEKMKEVNEDYLKQLSEQEEANSLELESIENEQENLVNENVESVSKDISDLVKLHNDIDDVIEKGMSEGEASSPSSSLD